MTNDGDTRRETEMSGNCKACTYGDAIDEVVHAIAKQNHHGRAAQATKEDWLT